MYKRALSDSDDLSGTRLFSVEALQRYTGLGRTTAVKIGKESGAVRKIGRRVLFDRQKIDAYIDSLEE